VKEILKQLLSSRINQLLASGGILVLIFAATFFIWWNKGVSFTIDNSDMIEQIDSNLPKSPISGIGCENAGRRPMAVMLSSDQETRPLSGIGQADIIFEMPVTPDGITRMVAIYQCSSPDEIGSVRSAREDFVPLAAGFGAVYAHWGGEKGALDELNKHVIDNIDALKYEGTYYFRKKGIKPPHNGFTNLEQLWTAVDELKYDKKSSFIGYPHSIKKEAKNITSLADSVSIDYPYPLNVIWAYDSENNKYKRTRGGTTEIDKNDGMQVEVSVVAVMRTTQSYISKDYISVGVKGEGDLKIYQNGIVISGRWEKGDDLTDKLFFYDNNGKEIEFVPGRIWVEIVTNSL